MELNLLMNEPKHCAKIEPNPFKLPLFMVDKTGSAEPEHRDQPDLSNLPMFVIDKVGDRNLLKVLNDNPPEHKPMAFSPFKIVFLNPPVAPAPVVKEVRIQAAKVLSPAKKRKWKDDADSRSISRVVFTDSDEGIQNCLN
jgi:hypothetical protein